MSKIFNPLADIGMPVKPTAPVVATENPAIFNALSGVVEASAQVSESAVFNTDVGICPKCKNSMNTAVLANNDSVYFCSGCKVSSPLKDATA